MQRCNRFVFLELNDCVHGAGPGHEIILEMMEVLKFACVFPRCGSRLIVHTCAEVC